MSDTGKTQSQTAGSSGSAKPLRRRRTRITSEKRIADDEFMAAAIGDVEWLRQSLRDAGGQINFDKNGLTALHLAAIHGRMECLKLLIEKFKYDINLPSSTGWRAIHLTISNQTGKRALQCLQYLLDKGADPSIGNNDGITPVHQAASEGHVQCLKFLIEIGAKIDERDCRGHTPLDLAKLWGHRKCARILAAECWHQDKDHVAKEMQQLKKVKMQQVLKELEEEEEFKMAQEFYGDKAFKEWLDKRKLEEKPTGPAGRDGLEKEKEEQTKKKQEPPKTGSEKTKDSLYKPNSVASKSSASARESKKESPPSPTKSIHVATGDKSPSSLGGRKLTQYTDDFEDGTDDENAETKPGRRSKSPGYVNPDTWKYALKAPSPEYTTNLTDDYPRDVYTLMPRTKSAPKFFDGKFRRKHPGKEDLGTLDTKEKLKDPDLPKEIIKRELSQDASVLERPIVFKCRHIHDVETKKKYSDEIKGKSEVSLHLCDDLSSFLFQNSIRRPSPAMGDKHNGSRRSSSHLSDWQSKKYPRERVINELRRMNKPTHFPKINGEEYDLNLGKVPTY